jgi:transposase InsO family protein
MRKIEEILRISRSEKAKYRLQVIEFHSKYGTETTKDAFGVSKATIYRWRSKYLRSRRDGTSLIPKSTRPINVNQMRIDSRIVEYIRLQREEHYRLGKEKIKPLLDEYCNSIHLKTISEASIGRVIKKYKLFSPKKGRIYHNPDSAYGRREISYKSRAKYSPKVNVPGYFEIDTITRIYQGKKIYVVNGVDVYTRFSFSYAYTTLTSSCTLDYLLKLSCVYQFHAVQTDNGLEFHGEFDRYLIRNNIKHIFTYPRCPKINGYIERCNRSLSEEFIEPNLSNIIDMRQFNQDLQKHITWYNTKRIHRGLKKLTPMDFISNLTLLSHMS